MTLPDAWPVVEVRVGPYFGTDGRPLEGERVTFEPRVKRIVLLDETTIVRRITSVTLDAAGEGVTELPVSDDEDLSSTGWTWQVREKFRHGQTFDIDVLTSDVAAGIDLSEVAPVVPNEPRSPFALAAQVNGLEDHGNVEGEVTFSGPTASHRFDATGPTTITLDDYAEGQVATLICFSGAADVTVNDAGDVTLVDGCAWSAELARDVWVSGGGGGEPAIPDTTPPSAVTDLTAEGGEGEIVLSWSAATDAESTVRYRYRVWLTSGGATGTWTTTTDTAATVTGLSAGAYTAEVYSYSNGGQTTADTATATVTAPAAYVEWDRHEFTAANGTLLSTLPTANGRTYAGTSAAVTIHDNKVAPSFFNGGSHNSTEQIALSPPAVAKMRQHLAYDNSNPSIGYTCWVQVVVYLAQTGTVEFGLQANANSDPTSSNFVNVGGSATGVTPSITYESGKSSSGHPVVGVLTVEVDTTTARVNLSIDNVLIGHIDCSAFTYGGNPNLPVTTQARFNLIDRAKVSQHIIEVFA